jgi:prophage regulatory protein
VITLLKKPTILKACGISKSTLHNRINDGLFTPPVSIGARAVAWPSNDVESITRAIIAGKGNDEIKLLVKVLIQKRKEREVA